MAETGIIETTTPAGAFYVGSMREIINYWKWRKRAGAVLVADLLTDDRRQFIDFYTEENNPNT